MLQIDNSFKEKLDSLEAGEVLLIDKPTLSEVPQELSTRDLVLIRTSRVIGFVSENDNDLPFEIDYSCMVSNWMGYKATYRDLGLALFSLLFNGKKYLKINLTHPHNNIKALYFFLPGENRYHYFLQMEKTVDYKAFEYYRKASENINHNLLDLEADVPSIHLGWSEKERDYGNLRDPRIANQYVVSLTPNSLIDLASFFLDFSAKSNIKDEFSLENPNVGIGGVSDMSLEARFWLPESFFFYTKTLDEYDPIPESFNLYNEVG